MPRPLISSVIILFAVAVAGCGGGWSDPPIDSMTLYSLDGTFTPGYDKPRKGETFQHYPVLGKTDIASAADRRAILNAVKKGIAESNGRECKCFWPRHGIRLVQNGRHIDYLICFHCYQLEMYTDDQGQHKATTDSPAPVLDKYLQRAGVPQQKP
jgi:hypothetical protein